MATFATAALDFKVDFNKILNDIFKAPNIQKWVFDTIQKRLYLEGETGTDVVLKTDSSGPDPYSPVTMDVKDFRGQRIGNVTLKDKGDFYASFRMALTLFGFEISADFDKESGHIYENFTKLFASKAEFEDAVLTLKDNEIEFMIKNMIIPKIQMIFNR